MTRVTEIRNWKDIARKVLAMAIAGVTTSGVIWFFGTIGIEIPQGYSALITTVIGVLSGYITPGTVPTDDTTFEGSEVH